MAGTAMTIAVGVLLGCSGVAMAAIWRFVYEVRPEGETQIGLQNAVWTGIGGSPVAWLQEDTFKLNTYAFRLDRSYDPLAVRLRLAWTGRSYAWIGSPAQLLSC